MQQILNLCDECKGTGLRCFICNEDEIDNVDYIPCYDFEDCPVCNGTCIRKEDVNDANATA